MPSFHSSCSLLGVTTSTTIAELRNTYKALALIHHPDKNQGANHEVWVKYQLAYEEVITVLDDAPELLQQSSEDSEPPTTTAHASEWRSHQTPKSPPRSWPLRKCPTALPTTLPPSSTPHPEPYTHTTLKNLHTQHLNLFRTLHTLSATLNTHCLTQKLHLSHPNLTRAAEYVSSFLLAEARTHRQLFHLLEQTEWWTKSTHSTSGGVARRQVRWYIDTHVHGTRGKLTEMRAWLDGFIARHVGKGKKVSEKHEERFVECARRWCPEDVEDKGEREQREREWREEMRARGRV